jgi:TonB family protein
VEPFPPLTNFSLGAPARPAAPAKPSTSARRFRGAIDMSLGPAAKGQADVSPYSNRDTDAAEADWRNALSRWVSEHAYYPSEAAHELQEGDSRVHVVMRPDGKVTSVELVGRSGSIWLDMALVSMFRDARLPPLPSGETEPLEFNFTMHYILRRMP